MLDALYNNGALKKTQLYMVSRLNYRRFNEYLLWLIRKGLAEHDGEYVRLTRKGAETYVKLYTLLRELLEKF